MNPPIRLAMGVFDDAGFDDGDPDIKRLHLLGQCLAERLQGKLGCGVRGQRRSGDVPSDRGHVDDESAPALAHLRRHRLDATQRPKVVGLHHRPELGQR